MSQVYYQKDPPCSNYQSDERICFKYMDIEAGTCFEIEDKRNKHIFFFLEGSVSMRYNEFPDSVFTAGEMMFLPNSADCKAKATTKSVFIVLVYDNLIKLYDNATFAAIAQQTKQVKYEFKSLPIVREMRQFLDLLRLYLSEGIDSRCLHRIKQQELFLLFEAYYEKEKLIQFFFPMIGKSMEFRARVMANYRTARTAHELAEACLYSERHFYKLFVEEFGESPYRWMQKQMSKHITARLYQEDIPIKEIINEFHFTSQSQFNRYCTRELGDAPQRIRRKLIAQYQKIETK